MAHHVEEVVKPEVLLKPTVQENGRLDESLLVTIKDPNPSRGLDVTFLAVAARAWTAMSRAAFDDAGLVLLPTDRGFGTYRDFQHQIDGFKYHYSQEFREGAKVKHWDDKTWFRKKDMEEAATPGESNHGLGLAIDVAYLNSAPTDKLSTWVLDNYKRFGFSHEFTSGADPRHIRYYAGDDIPDAVLGSPEIIDQGGRGRKQPLEDQMLPIITNAQAQGKAEPLEIKFVLMDNGKLRGLSEAEWLVRGGLTGTAWTDEEITAAGFGG